MGDVSNIISCFKFSYRFSDEMKNNNANDRFNESVLDFLNTEKSFFFDYFE